MLEFLKKLLAPRSVDGALVHLKEAVDRVHACAARNDQDAARQDGLYDYYAMKAEVAQEVANEHREEAARARRVAARLLEVIA